MFLTAGYAAQDRQRIAIIPSLIDFNLYVKILAGLFSFFFNDTATTEIYTLSLHDALPIFHDRCHQCRRSRRAACVRHGGSEARSEEHTSELQSQSNLVCRLLLEKKKRTNSSALQLAVSKITVTTPTL